MYYLDTVYERPFSKHIYKSTLKSDYQIQELITISRTQQTGGVFSATSAVRDDEEGEKSTVRNLILLKLGHKNLL